MAGHLVIVRHYEPPAPEEAAELLHCVYERLFDAALLERLTRSPGESTIQVSEREEKGEKDEGCAVRKS
jgi:hypothetical protein